MKAYPKMSLKQTLKAGTALGLPLLFGLAVSSQAMALDAGALPTGGVVVGGAASVAATPGHLQVTQSTDRAAIDWRSFDIGSQASVNFAQPSRTSVALNRVNGSANASQIMGSLTANGTVMLLNPNGVVFGPNSHVDVGGLVASTGKIDVNRFMAGDNSLTITGATVGEIVVQGHITARDGGLAAFVAPSVRNSGVIVANLGKVALAAGETATLDLYGDHLIELGFGAANPLVLNSGQIDAAGGRVELSAKAASALVDGMINNSGVISAASVDKVGGAIVLSADNITTTANATLNADGVSGGQITAIANKTGDYAGSWSAQGSNGDGGKIETSGATVNIADGIKVNTLASNGATGSWTLDPNSLTVGSSGSGTITAGTNDDGFSAIKASTVVSALDTTDVNLQANVTISVNSAIDASGNTNAHNLTLVDQNGGGLTINLNAPITLKTGGALSGQGTIVNVASTGLIQNGVDVALAGGATVNVAAGVYAPNVNINKSGLSLLGATGAEIDVDPGSSSAQRHQYRRQYRRRNRQRLQNSR